MADFFEPNEFYRRGGYVINLLNHILHVLGLDEILYLLHIRRRLLGPHVNSVAIFDSGITRQRPTFGGELDLNNLNHS